MTGYYDLVLGMIPVALFGISGALSLAGVTTTSAVTVAAALALALVGHALFVRAPTPRVPGAETVDEQPQAQSAQVGPVNAD